MMKYIKNVFNNWQAERRRQRFLNIHLEKLTDPTFLDREANE